jgi:hypothetical protein
MDVTPSGSQAQFSLASDSGPQWARKATFARPLPVAAGESGGMRTTNENAIDSSWMNPVTGQPRPGSGKGTVLR